MKRNQFLDKLDQLTNKAATLVIRDAMPVSNKEKIFVGSVFVEKNSKGYYNINTIGGKLLYEDISTLEIAIIIAQRYSNNEMNSVNQILNLEEIYYKNHTEMMQYLRCYKGAKREKDKDRMYILEDKFKIAEEKARYAKERILYFKRLK